MLMIKSHGRVARHEQAAVISLKQSNSQQIRAVKSLNEQDYSTTVVNI